MNTNFNLQHQNRQNNVKETQEYTDLERLVMRRHLTKEELQAFADAIRNPPSGRIHHHEWGKGRRLIGLMGDTHIGSKYCDYDVLNDVYRRFKAEGVEAVYHCGDMTEGYNRRKGQAFECDLHGADEQVRGVVERYPKIGVTTHFITGDHDSWHMDNGGVDVGKAIRLQRPDMDYLGAMSATVKLGKNTTLMLMHPASGTAYAISYKPQKIVEALSGGEKPNILAIGHYHKSEYLFYRNVHVFQSGCIQRQTSFMKRMNLSAHVSAWILDISIDKRGTIDKLKQTVLPYY